MPADDGPADWQHIDVEVDPSRDDGLEPGASGRKIDIVQPAQAIIPKKLAAVTVSNVHLGDQDLSFSVDKVGVPVLVKISYFPNWHVSGAEGPYRIAPNLMVVVPTANDVHLTYERSQLDNFAYILTFIGIGLLIFMRFRGDVRHANTHPFGSNTGPTEFLWDDWEPPSEEMLVDPTPPDLLRPDPEDSLEAESSHWEAPPPAVPTADSAPTDDNV